jgi:ankyrin repeat protein
MTRLCRGPLKGCCIQVCWVLICIFVFSSYLLILIPYIEVKNMDELVEPLQRVARHQNTTTISNCTLATSSTYAFATTSTSCTTWVRCGRSVFGARHPFDLSETTRPHCGSLPQDNMFNVVNTTIDGVHYFFLYWQREEIQLALDGANAERTAYIGKWVFGVSLSFIFVYSVCIALRCRRIDCNSSRLLKLVVCCGCYAPPRLVRCAMTKSDVNATMGPKKWTALHFAVEQNRLSTVNALLSSPDINVDVQAVDGMTPLHYAAMHDHKAVLNRLLAASPNVDALDSFGFTALMYATRQNNCKCVRALLAAGASTYVVGMSMTPLYLAVRNKHEKVTQILLDSGDSWARALPKAFYVDDILAILRGSGNVNLTDVEFGRTALHRACYSGRKLVVERLLELDGIDANAHDIARHTPLYLAAWCGQLDCVQLLIEHGVGHAATDGGYVPLHAAAAVGHDHVVKYLIEKGADVNAVDGFGDRPISVVGSVASATELPAVACLNALIAAGADVNALSAQGLSPIFSMARDGYAMAVRVLLAAGADHERRLFNRTTLEMAAENDHPGVVQALLQLTDIDVDVVGATIIAIAARSGAPGVVRLMLALGVVPDDALVSAVAQHNEGEIQSEENVEVSDLFSAMSAVNAPKATADVDVVDDVDDKASDGMKDALDEDEEDFNDSDDDDDDDDNAASRKSTKLRVIQPKFAKQRQSVISLRAQLVRDEVFVICVALQSLELSALELLTIIDAAGKFARHVPMHVKWNMICCIRHRK